jgi:transposase
MADAMHDAMQEGSSYRPIELITGERRRRQWTAEENARIVAESFEEGANISEVARRNGVVRGLRTMRRHKLAAAAGVQALSFVPVRIARKGGPATGRAELPGAGRIGRRRRWHRPQASVATPTISTCDGHAQ